MDVFKKMGQDFEPSYFDTGQFCWFNIKQTISTGSLISSKTKGMILNQFEYQDVNTLDEWEMLKIKYNYMLNKMIKRPKANIQDSSPMYGFDPKIGFWGLKNLNHKACLLRDRKSIDVYHNKRD